MNDAGGAELPVSVCPAAHVRGRLARDDHRRPVSSRSTVAPSVITVAAGRLGGWASLTADGELMARSVGDWGVFQVSRCGFGPVEGQAVSSAAASRSRVRVMVSLFRLARSFVPVITGDIHIMRAPR